MAETAMIVVGALMFVGGGLGVFSEDRDIYPRVKVFAVAVCAVGAILIALGVKAVMRG